MQLSIAVLPGDGIGPDIVKEAQSVLERVAEKFSHRIEYQQYDAGGAAIDKLGEPLPEKTLAGCRASDSILLGAVGGPQWDHLSGSDRPERALLGLRGALELYANLRPAVLYEPLREACPLQADIAAGGIDIMVVRELTGGIYFGDRGRRQGRYGEEAYDTEAYGEAEVERIARTAFDIARKRKKHVTSVDKANVLESSRLWRSVVVAVAGEYPDVTLEHMYVDNAAMQLVRDPSQFDVLVTTNMFGDILSDEASMITGSIGMLPSASLGKERLGMYEPIHGSAPDIAGQDKANPIATILSAAMMLRYSFGLAAEADAVEAAVSEVLQAGYRTGDIASAGTTLVGTRKMGQLICEAL